MGKIGAFWEEEGVGKDTECGEGQRLCKAKYTVDYSSLHHWAKCFSARKCKVDDIRKEIHAEAEEYPSVKITFFQCAGPQVQEPRLREPEVAAPQVMWMLAPVGISCTDTCSNGCDEDALNLLDSEDKLIAAAGHVGVEIRKFSVAGDSAATPYFSHAPYDGGGPSTWFNCGWSRAHRSTCAGTEYAGIGERRLCPCK